MTVESISNLDQIAKDMRRFATDRAFLESRRRTISRRHDKRWVAVLDKKLMYADGLEELLEKAQAKGWEVRRMVVAYLEHHRQPRILGIGGPRLL